MQFILMVLVLILTGCARGGVVLVVLWLPLSVGQSQEPTKPLIVGWYEHNGTSFNIYVKRWTGEAWEALGEALDVNVYQPANLPNLALDNFGQPLASWNEDSLSSDIYVKHWTGQNWTHLGDALDVHANTLALFSNLVTTKAGQPIVTWHEFDGTTFNVYVKRWNGTLWEQLGQALDSKQNSDATLPYLALDSSDNPVVSWAGYNSSGGRLYIKRWDGQQWLSVGRTLELGPDSFPVMSKIVLDGSDQLVIAFAQCALDVADRCVNFNVYVKRWQQDDWVSLGQALDANILHDAYNPSLVLDSVGQPIVTWNEFTDTSYDIYVKRWNGRVWELLGKTLDRDAKQDAYSPSLILDGASQPVVAWYEGNGASSNIYVKRWNGSTWQDLGEHLDRYPDREAIFPSLAR